MNARRYSERVAGHAALMTCMMGRVGIEQADVSRIDGGLAFWAAQTKCIFCPDHAACKAWLAEAAPATSPAAFCPNIPFFQSARGA